MKMTTIELSNENKVNYKEVDGTFYHYETNDKIIQVLERVRNNKNRIRMYLGDTVTGKSWNEENDTLGYVGRSSGNIKIPLLIYNSNSHGGGGILDHCIIKIVDTKTNTVLYSHDKFHIGKFTLHNNDNEELLSKGYLYSVKMDREIYANFKNEEKAKRYVDFMTGKRNSK